MKKVAVLALVLLCFFGTDLCGQTKYLLVDKYAQTLPDQGTDYRDIARVLTENFIWEEEKIRAIYVWIAHHIQYDLEQLATTGVGVSTDIDLAAVIGTGKGICQDYSELFAKMCQSVGIESYVIKGMTRQVNGALASESHAWNAVRIYSTYYLLDLTWSAGFVVAGKYVHQFRDDYFLQPPKSMIATHLPFDPLWQFLDNPVTLAEFTRGDFSKLMRPGSWQFADSLAAQHTLTPVVWTQQKLTRMMDYQTGAAHATLTPLAAEEIGYTQCNLAIAYFNQGVEAYNTYLDYRNRWFKKPPLADEEIAQLMTTATYSAEKAEEILRTVTSDDLFLQEFLEEFSAQLANHRANLNNEEAYVAKYLNTWKPLRFFVQ